MSGRARGELVMARDQALAVAITAVALIGCATSSKEDATSAHTGGTRSSTDDAVIDLPGEDEIRQLCEEEWPGNWAMIANCVERRTRGVRRLRWILVEHNIRDDDTTPEAMIFAKCSREWPGEWNLIASCFERQLGGYRRLNP
jgi:hypothetical protein